MKITATATIVRGKKSNRVRLSNVRPDRARIARGRKAELSPQRALIAYRKDPSTRGMDYVVVSFSLPVEDLAAMDALAEKCQMARSHLIRQAVKHFAAKVMP